MSKTVLTFVAIVAAVIFVTSGARLGWHYYLLHSAESAYEVIRETIVEDDDAEDEEEFHTISVDFDSLATINSDIIAWLYIPDTAVSFPVLYGPDNQTYLTQSYDSSYSALGSIFMDYRNDSAFSDLNTVIYGHNTSSDAMFGGLKKFKDQEYADERTEIHILKKDEARVYEIFSVYETPATSNTYAIKFPSDDLYGVYLREMAGKSLVLLSTSPDLEQILTLSTCTGGNKAMRLVLQAKFIKAHPIK